MRNLSRTVKTQRTRLENVRGLAILVSIFALYFAGLGVIGDALNINLGLEPTSWLLLAIVAGLNAIIGHTHVVVAKHLLGIETESKKE